MPNFEDFLAQGSRQLLSVNAERFAAVAEEVLAGIARFFDTERAVLQRIESGQLVVRCSWGSEELLERRPAADATAPFHWYLTELRAGRDIVLGRIPEDLPAEAEAERDYCARVGMKSHVTVPLTVSGRFAWSLSTASFRRPRPWSPSEIQRLRNLGGVLAAAAERVELELELAARVAELEELHSRLRAETDYLRAERTAEHGFHEIVGRAPALLRTLAMVDHVAPTPSTVLLLGETGTGKELLARAIHDRSPRRHAPLVRINCAAVPATLIESELFGHEKGAFTGAIAARAGRFEIAAGGTLLLDEIGDLPAEVQIKLLRVLQEHEFQRVGSARTIKTDIRLIAATHRDLETEVREGRFRSDLYFRLNVFPIRVPPLRERREDIPLLAWAFVDRLQGGMGLRIRRIREEDLAALTAYSWPGNVRELENVVERALILSKGETLALNEAFRVEEPAAERQEDLQRLDDLERRHIRQVLAACGGKIAGHGNAAERLGLHPNTLRSRMQRLGVAREAPS